MNYGAQWQGKTSLSKQKLDELESWLETFVRQKLDEIEYD